MIKLTKSVLNKVATQILINKNCVTLTEHALLDIAYKLEKTLNHDLNRESFIKVSVTDYTIKNRLLEIDIDYPSTMDFKARHKLRTILYDQTRKQLLQLIGLQNII